MFPEEIIRVARFIIQAARKLKWLFVLSFYYGAFISLALIGQLWLTLSFIPLLSLTCLAYVIDKRREEKGVDSFRGDRMFFRYGELIYHTTISIPVRQEWSFAATEVSATTLRTTLAQHVAARLPSNSVQVLENKTITDLGTGQKKDFTRVRVHTPLGSSITFFIYYAAFGHTITAQYFTYRRGPRRQWEAVKFLFAGPLTIWIWGLPWLLNRFSIISHISRDQTDAFDAIDLDTMYKVAYTVVLEETSRILRAAKLLSQAIEQAIHFHINSVNNQSIIVKGSSNVNIGNGNIAQSPLPTTQPRPTPQPAA